MNPHDPCQIYTPEELAPILGRTVWTVRKMIREQRIPTISFGLGKRAVPKLALHAWLASATVPPDEVEPVTTPAQDKAKLVEQRDAAEGARYAKFPSVIEAAKHAEVTP